MRGRPWNWVVSRVRLVMFDWNRQYATHNFWEHDSGLLLAGFKKSYLCPAWVDSAFPAS